MRTPAPVTTTIFLAAATICALTALTACKEDDNQVCKPGVSRACYCDANHLGAQLCLNSGKGYTDCYCGDLWDGDLDTAFEWEAEVEVGDDSPVESIDTTDDASCTNDQTTCLGTTVYLCVENAWTEYQNCATWGLVCRDGQCSETVDGDQDTDPGEQEVVCVQGQTMCIGAFVFSCVGGQWQEYEDCTDNEMTCASGRCVCSDGQTRCDGDVVVQCLGNQWYPQTYCETTGQVCRYGQCMCSPGTVQCQGTVMYYCDDDHQWYEDYDCINDDLACDPVNGCVNCQDNATACQGDYLYLCQDGYFVYYLDCSSNGLSCQAGVCQ